MLTVVVFNFVRPVLMWWPAVLCWTLLADGTTPSNGDVPPSTFGRRMSGVYRWPDAFLPTLERTSPRARRRVAPRSAISVPLAGEVGRHAGCH
jgi:hypothetical protein